MGLGENILDRKGKIMKNIMIVSSSKTMHAMIRDIFSCALPEVEFVEVLAFYELVDRLSKGEQMDLLVVDDDLEGFDYESLKAHCDGLVAVLVEGDRTKFQVHMCGRWNCVSKPVTRTSFNVCLALLQV